jgi:hypothetical protein
VTAEAATAVLAAIGFMVWSGNIDVNPMDRKGQVSGLAQLQFRLAICALILVTALVVAQRLLRGRGQPLLIGIGCAAVAGLASGLVAGGMQIALRGTPFGLWAGGGDYAWILRWVAQMAEHQPTPDYYPPLFLKLLQWWSSVSGKPAVYAIRDLQLVGTALFGPLAYLCWRLVLSPGWALGIGLVAAFPFIEPVKPYPQLTLVLLMPVLIALLRQVHRADQLTPIRAVGVGVGYGAALGLLFLLYSGWFIWGAAGVLAAIVLLAPWRRGALRVLTLGGSAGVVFLAIAWVHLRGLLAGDGALSDDFFYFDTSTDPAYFAMWRNDVPGDINPSLWPPPAEWAGVGLFTIALAVGLGVALWLGWRRTPVITVGLFAVSAWLLRMYLAGESYATQTVRLFPRTTAVLLYCTLILTGFAVKYAVEAISDRLGRAPVAGPESATLVGPDTQTPAGARVTASAGIPVGLALIPLIFLFASGGSDWVNHYLPGKAGSYGAYAADAQNRLRLDGRCSTYATTCRPKR